MAAATALLALPGCDDDSYPEGLDELDIGFRGGDSGGDDGGDRDGPDKLNTNSLGDEDLPLNNIPLALGAEPTVELLAITSHHCVPPGGGPEPIFGAFTTEHTGSHLNLSLTPEGVLGPLWMSKVDDPAFVCTLSGDQWEDTYWHIRATYDGLAYDTDLWLTDLATDDDGYQLYAWYVNYLNIDPTYAGELPYRPTCDEDTTNTAQPGLEFHAYMVEDLRVKPTGVFAPRPDSMYIACLSGAVGKSMQWHYKPDTGLHETATRMVRADYCGDGVSHTVPGTPIRLQDDSFYPDDPPAGYAMEAAWSASSDHVLCLDTPRLGGTVSCDDPIPTCTAKILGHADMITHVPPAP